MNHKWTQNAGKSWGFEYWHTTNLYLFDWILGLQRILPWGLVSNVRIPLWCRKSVKQGRPCSVQGDVHFFQPTFCQCLGTTIKKLHQNKDRGGECIPTFSHALNHSFLWKMVSRKTMEISLSNCCQKFSDFDSKHPDKSGKWGKSRNRGKFAFPLVQH